MCLSEKPPAEHRCVFQIRKDFFLLESWRGSVPEAWMSFLGLLMLRLFLIHGVVKERDVDEQGSGATMRHLRTEGVHLGASTGEKRSAWLQPSPSHGGKGIWESLPREWGHTEKPAPAKEKGSQRPKTNTLLAQPSIPWGSIELHPCDPAEVDFPTNASS